MHASISKAVTFAPTLSFAREGHDVVASHFITDRHAAKADGFTRPPVVHPMLVHQMRDSVRWAAGRHHFFPKDPSKLHCHIVRSLVKGGLRKNPFTGTVFVFRHASLPQRNSR